MRFLARFRKKAPPVDEFPMGTILVLQRKLADSEAARLALQKQIFAAIESGDVEKPADPHPGTDFTGLPDNPFDADAWK